MVQQQSHGSKQLQKELLDSCGLIIDGGCISHLPLACSLALYCAQSAGEVVSDLKVWLHWTVGNWVVLQAGLGWLLPACGLCVWLPVSQHTQVVDEYQHVIFSIHGAKVETKLSVGYGPFSAIKYIPDMQSYPGEMRLLAQPSYGTHVVSRRQVELLFFEPHTLEWGRNDFVLLQEYQNVSILP